MQIEITIPRPGVTLLAIVAVTGWYLALRQPTAPTAAVVSPEVPVVQGNPVGGQRSSAAPLAIVEPDHTHDDADVVEARGGDDTPPVLRQQMAEWRVLQAREEQQVLLSKQQILRTQLEALQQQRRALGAEIDPKLEEQFTQGVRMLVGLLEDEKRGSDFLRTAIAQVWEAQGRTLALATGNPANILLAWPVPPLKGISAHFLDKEYKKIFKMEHYAIDIPVPQGSPVRAAANGTVRDVVDGGLGFSYITIEHDDGTVTLYGHMSAFRVKSGDSVFAGTIIGSSGGMPGTRGAGMTTGPHLHFALYIKGTPVDPLPYLPQFDQ